METTIYGLGLRLTQQGRAQKNILGLVRDNGKENESCYKGLLMFALPPLKGRLQGLGIYLPMGTSRLRKPLVARIRTMNSCLLEIVLIAILC